MAVYLGEFEQLILFALVHLGDRAYGVNTRQEIEARTGRVVTAGAIYTALDRLEKRGLVSSRVGEETPTRGGRRRKYYTVEPAGAKALQRSQQTMQQMGHGLLAKLAGLAGDHGAHASGSAG